MTTENASDADPTSQSPRKKGVGTTTMKPKKNKNLPQESDESAEEPAETDRLIGSKSEHGGQTGPEPTRYGDWEKNGRCTDF